jgi:hypothetical protein
MRDRMHDMRDRRQEIRGRGPYIVMKGRQETRDVSQLRRENMDRTS